ncbi:MAG: hypothetical protein P4K98_06600 [Bryobacteraceae bacterium]|nr:hypothetical protein [Bryobacteraceae bacterium]
MGEKKLCHLCQRRAPRRYCPALEREICTVCCGTEREQSIACPLDCEHLRDARYHERLPELDPKSLPNPEIELSESFMNSHQELAIILGRLLFVAAVENEGVVDSDMRDALAALVTSFKTANSGLIYEARPENAIAAAVVTRFREELDKFRADVAERAPAHAVLDKDLLGVLVFWQRMEFQRSNGRRKGRAFIESLYGILPPPPEEKPGESSGIVTNG